MMKKILTLISILMILIVPSYASTRLELSTTEYEKDGKYWIQPVIENRTGETIKSAILKVEFSKAPDNVKHEEPLSKKLVNVKKVLTFRDSESNTYFSHIQEIGGPGIAVSSTFGFDNSDVTVRFYLEDTSIPEDLNSPELPKILNNISNSVLVIDGIGQEAFINEQKNNLRAKDGEKTIIKRQVGKDQLEELRKQAEEIEAKNQEISKSNKSTNTENSKNINQNEKENTNKNEQTNESFTFKNENGNKVTVKTVGDIIYTEEEKSVDSLTDDDIFDNKETELEILQEKERLNELNSQEKLNKTNSKEALESSETDSQNNSKTQLDSTSNNNSSNLIYIVIGLVILGVLAGGGFLIWKQRQ